MKQPADNHEAPVQKGNIHKKGLILWIAAAAALLGICCFFLGLSASNDGRIFPVYITEVLASNTSYPNADGRCCDYIELYNSAGYAVDLTGFQLGDIAGSGRYAFPAGTVMEANSYLVVYCDKTADSPDYAQFGISRSGGEAFYLIASNNAIVDSVTTIAMDLDEAMALQSSGEWVLASPTPGQANDIPAQDGSDIYNSGVSPVRITEFASNATFYAGEYGLRCDWVELHNTSAEAVDISGFTLSDNVGNDKYCFPSGTVIGADGYLVVPCSDAVGGEDIAPFNLSQLGGEAIVLKNASGMIVELVSTSAMDDSGSMALDSGGSWSLTGEASPGFENTSAGHQAFLRSIGAAKGTIVISEVMSATQAILLDQFGEFSDWVELYNSGSETVELAGWFLSDDPAQPDKWTFPEAQIEPGQRLIVFCSGADTAVNGQLHTNFSLSAGGESLILSCCLGTSVDSVTFGSSENNCSFLFEDGSEGCQTDLPTPGYPNDAQGYEQFCAASAPAGPLAIWEVMTANDWYLPQSLGACYDWVELHNVSDSTINLSDYSITDDSDDHQMYVLPERTLAPGESIVIILSGDESLSTSTYAHAGFSLNASEDQLLLYGSGGELIDYVYLKQIPLGYSYGRAEDGSGFYYMDPTPNAANGSGYRMVSSVPTSEIPQGVYVSETGFTVPLEAQGTIYYTTDGSDPDAGSTAYSGPIQISQTTVLRAVAVEDGKLPSEIYTATFLIGVSHDIPVVSLVTDPDNLWGTDGIYKNGNIDIKEEKRSANIAYVGSDGSFSLDCEISLHGATTVTAFNKKSFSLRFQDSYDGWLNYDLFEDGEVTTFKSLILRTAHESTVSTHMRDALMGYIASSCSDSLICQKYKYVALYLNGEYWGLYALRELHSQEHYASYMDVPAASVTMSKSYIEAGTDLYDLFNFCKTNDLRSEENYAYAQSLLDMDSFADWIIFQSYAGNIDINGNMRYYRCDVDGLWRCGLVDVDLGMFSTVGFDNVATTFHHSWIVSRLMDNETFQDLLATRLAQLLSGPLSDENMTATIDAMADTIRSEIPREAARWDYTTESWENQVRDLRDFCDGRAEALIDNLCSQLGFTQEEKTAYFGSLIQ